MGDHQGKPTPDTPHLVTPVTENRQDPDKPTKAKGPGNQTAEGEISLGHDIQRHIGRKLKAMYSDLIDQPVPERFQELLAELERKEKSR